MKINELYHISKILVLTLVLTTVYGCANPYYVDRKNNIEYAKEAINNGNFVAAYRLLEDYLDGRSGFDQATKVIKDYNLSKYGYDTFSLMALSNSKIRYGNDSLSLEYKRKELFFKVATEEQRKQIIQNFRETYQNYDEFEKYERLSSEEREQAQAKAKLEREKAEAKAKLEREQAEAKAKLEREQARAAELDAKKYSFFVCNNEKECKRAFTFTQIFISEQASYKIQIATDTIVETYGGNKGVSMKAVKKPLNNGKEIIELSVSYGEILYYPLYHAFMEKNMKY